MSLALGFVLVVAAAVAQMSILPAFSIFGVQPNVLIVVLVAWMSVRGRQEALFLIPAAGFVLGLLDSQPVGLAMLALAPLIPLTEVRELRLVESQLVPALALVAVASLAYETTILISLAVRGEHLDWLASVLDVLVPAAVANALLLLPVYGLLRLVSLPFQRQPAF